MKFPTQHRTVVNHNVNDFYTAHRDGATTWKSKSDFAPYDTTNHPTVAAAKKWISDQ